MNIAVSCSCSLLSHIKITFSTALLSCLTHHTMHLPGLNDIICNHTIFPRPVTSPGVQVFSLFLKMLDTKPQKASKVASTSLWDPFFPLSLNHRTAFRSSNRKDFVWFVKEPVDQTQTQPLFLKLKIKSENSLHICSFF